MNNNVDSEVLQELLEIIDEKNAEIRWMRRKVQNLEKREEDYFREEGNYDILRKSKIGKKFIMPFLLRLRKCIVRKQADTTLSLLTKDLKHSENVLNF